MKALVVNALGRGFDVEDAEIARPKGRGVRVEVQASGLCHTHLLFAGASRIVVIDIQPQRLDPARRFGATDLIDSTKSKPVEAVRDLLPGGTDHVFDFVGLKLVADEGLAMLGVGGGLYLVGVSEARRRFSLNIFGPIWGQKRVVGANCGSTNREA
jgi:S-(hydroxymethyl)glutathione dehydrogenase/alcohol dehydrogenase